MKSELEDLFLSFCITLNTEVGVTSENFENCGDQFKVGVKSDLVGCKFN